METEILPESRLRPQNKRALALLADWYAEPDDLGKAWRVEFEADLRKHRFFVKEIEELWEFVGIVTGDGPNLSPIFINELWLI